jgi:hypothetical protein
MAGRTHVVLRVIVNQLPEEPAVHVLPDETLDLADAIDRFGERGRHATEALLLGAVGAAQFGAEMSNHQAQNGRHGEHDQKQLPIVIQHEQRRDEHVTELHRAHERDILHADPHRIHVRGHTADQATDLRALEEAHGQGQQVRVDLVAQIVHHGFAQAQREAHAKYEANLGDACEEQEAHHAEQGAARVLTRDRATDDGGDRPSHDRSLNRARDDQGDERVTQRGVGLRVRENAANYREIQRALFGVLGRRRLTEAHAGPALPPSRITLSRSAACSAAAV